MNKTEKNRILKLNIKKRTGGLPNWALLSIAFGIVFLAIGAIFALWYSGAQIDLPDDDYSPFQDDPEHTAASGDGQAKLPAPARSEGSFNILFVGKDKVGANTDVILIINFNTETQKINVLQVPRDTYIESDINVNRSKRVNALYAYGYIETGTVHGGLEILESNLEKTFGITIDKYFLVNLSGFNKIVDSIGGVTVDIPQNLYYVDPAQDLYINLKKGVTELDGNKAEQFVRYRQGYLEGDLGRITAQRIFLTAFIKKMLSSSWFNVSSLTTVANTVVEYSTTNLKSTDIAGYFKKVDLSKISGDSITFYTAPGESFKRPDTGAWYYSLYKEETLQLINDCFNVYNKKIEEKHVSLVEVSRTEGESADINGYTASEIDRNQPKIAFAGGSSPSSPAQGSEPPDDGDALPVIAQPEPEDPAQPEPRPEDPAGSSEPADPAPPVGDDPTEPSAPDPSKATETPPDPPREESPDPGDTGGTGDAGDAGDAGNPGDAGAPEPVPDDPGSAGSTGTGEPTASDPADPVGDPEQG